MTTERRKKRVFDNVLKIQQMRGMQQDLDAQYQILLGDMAAEDVVADLKKFTKYDEADEGKDEREAYINIGMRKVMIYILQKSGRIEGGNPHPIPLPQAGEGNKRNERDEDE